MYHAVHCTLYSVQCTVYSIQYMEYYHIRALFLSYLSVSVHQYKKFFGVSGQRSIGHLPCDYVEIWWASKI